MKIYKIIVESVLWRSLLFITAFIVNICIARALGAELSGQIFFLINSLYLFVLIGSLSLESGLLHYTSGEKKAALFLPVFMVLWSVFAAVFMFILFLILPLEMSTFSRSQVYIGSICYLFGSLLTIFFSAFHQAKDDYKTPALISCSINVVLIIAFAGYPLIGGLSADALFLFYFSSFLIQGLMLAAFFFSKKPFGKEIKFDFQVLRKMIHFSLLAFIGNLAFFLLYRIDYWIVEKYCSPKELGIYIQASKALQVLLLLPVFLHGVLFQQFSKAIDHAHEVINKLVLWLILFYLATGLVSYFFGPMFISLLWGYPYSGLYQPLIRSFPGAFFLAISYLFSALFSAAGFIRFNVIIALVTLIVMLILDISLIPKHGINGAAWASSAGYLFMLLFYLFIAIKKLNFSFRLKKEFLT